MVVDVKLPWPPDRWSVEAVWTGVAVPRYRVALSAPGPEMGEAMGVILSVRIPTGLDLEEMNQRPAQRRRRFLDVAGLVQKIYGRDPDTGDVGGVYFFDSTEALATFRESELARTIPEAYEATSARREVCDVLYPLGPECGPLSEATPTTAAVS